MYRVIAFDMDGTLIDSDRLVASIYRAYFKEHPSPVNPAMIPVEDLFAKSYEENLKFLQVEPLHIHLGYIRDIHQRLVGKKLKRFPFSLSLLTTLRKRGYHLALLTSEMKSIALHELEQTQLGSMFEFVLTYDDLIKPKPDPEGLHRIVDHFGYPKEKVLFVGDRINDGLAAKRAGITAIGVHRAHGMEPVFARTFKNLKQVKDYILASETTHDFALGDGLTILQFTDLHLKGDGEDLLTETLIEETADEVKPNLIVFTGDQTMGKNAPIHYAKWAGLMDRLRIPFTFVFGNHDAEVESHRDILQAIESSKSLMFHPGPKGLGFSNFRFTVSSQGAVVRQLMFFDTHSEREYRIDGQTNRGYDHLAPAQLELFKTWSSEYPTVPSFLFMHIPFKEFASINPEDKERYRGDYDEPCSVAPTDPALFLTLKEHRVQAVFVGHDHYNAFDALHEGVRLIYGRCSGHYDYGKPGFPKGARVIKIDSDGTWTTSVVLHQDLIQRSKK